METILIYAFPVFLIFIAIEALASRYDESRKYRLNDSVSNLSCGIFDQLVNAFIGTIFIGIYAIVQRGAGIITFKPQNFIAWILLFVAVDFFYYLFHRASHRINFLWGTHIVHHQSESYNLTVSLRQGTLATWITYLFYLPLAFLGFPAAMFLVAHSIFQLYQFLVHTNMIKNLGPLEVFIATPKIHSIHHARNSEYLDKNYGGLLNIWDRLFGSFMGATDRNLNYGITTGIRKWNPLWANLHYFSFLWKSSRSVKGIENKIKVWLMPPEGRVDDMIIENYNNGYNSTLQQGWFAYVLSQLGLGITGAFTILLYRDELDALMFIEFVFLILLTLVTVNGLFDRSRWVVVAEYIRHFLVLGLLIWLSLSLQAWYLIPTFAYIIIFTWFFFLERKFGLR